MNVAGMLHEWPWPPSAGPHSGLTTPKSAVVQEDTKVVKIPVNGTHKIRNKKKHTKGNSPAVQRENLISLNSALGGEGTEFCNKEIADLQPKI